MNAIVKILIFSGENLITPIGSGMLDHNKIPICVIDLAFFMR